jgi:hypothetical protein
MFGRGIVEFLHKRTRQIFSLLAFGEWWFSLIDRKRLKMVSYSEPGSNQINMYQPKFNASDSDYLKYGFGRVKLDDIKKNSIVFFFKIYRQN